MFIPVWGNKKNVVFFNPNVRLDTKSSSEENLGVGYRTLVNNDQIILGANAFFDAMHSRYDNSFSQLGAGVEALSKWVDFRANYYNPTGSRTKRMEAFDAYGFGPTSVLVYKGYEEAMRGADAEVGVLIPAISDIVETRVFLGGYWYDSSVVNDLEGWRSRIEIRPWSILSLNAQVRHDQVRGTDAFYGAYLDIPFSIETLFKGGNPFNGLKETAAFAKGARSVRDRMTEKVIRDLQITTIAKAKKDGETVPGFDNLIYVNKENPNLGDGTLTNPYNDINSALKDSRYRPGAVVYVFSGTRLLGNLIRGI